MQIRSHWRRLFCLAFWLGVAGVIAVSLTPGTMLPRIPLDLLYHALAYAGLALFAAAGHTGERNVRLAMAGLVCLGIALEFAQELVPGRAGSFEDALANAAGIGVVTVLWWKYLRNRPDAGTET